MGGEGEEVVEEELPPSRQLRACSRRNMLSSVEVGSPAGCMRRIARGELAVCGPRSPRTIVQRQQFEDAGPHGWPTCVRRPSSAASRTRSEFQGWEFRSHASPTPPSSSDLARPPGRWSRRGKSEYQDTQVATPWGSVEGGSGGVIPGKVREVGRSGCRPGRGRQWCPGGWAATSLTIVLGLRRQYAWA